MAGEDVRIPSDHFAVQPALHPQGVPDRTLLLTVDHVGPGLAKLVQRPVVYVIEDHQRVLRGARSGVVEGLGGHDAGGGLPEVGGAVDDHGHVAGAHSDRRFAAPVGAAHVVLRPGDHGQVASLHQCRGGPSGDRFRKDLDQIGRCIHALQRRPHQFHRARRGRIGERRGCDYDRVAALDGHHRLVDGGGGGIGGRRDRGHHPDRLGVDHQAPGGILLDQPHRPGPAQISEGAEGLAAVLDDLVRDVPEAGGTHGELGQFPGVLGFVERPGQRRDHLVHPTLVRVGELGHRRPRSVHPRGNDLARRVL